MISQFQELGKLVSTQRKKVGLSQVELSNKIGYKSGQFISNIERALCGIPDEKILDLARALQINFNFIINAILEDKKNSIMTSIKIEIDRENYITKMKVENEARA